MKSNAKRKTKGKTIDLARCTEIDDLISVAARDGRNGCQIADSAEISPATFYRYKNKPVYRPQFPTMRRLAWALGLSYQLVSTRNLTRMRKR